MGIKGLMKVIKTMAPSAITPLQMKDLCGRKIAVDASVCLYQFLIAVRPNEGHGTLTNSLGDPTSHINGIFYRTIKLMEAGIRPVYVFDGKYPELKSNEIAKRLEKRQVIEEKIKADQVEDKDLKKALKRTVHVTKQHTKEAHRLLDLMGIPCILSPEEAEAQCTSLVNDGICYATASEDMDCLTLGSKILIRHLSSESKTKPLILIELSKVLQGLEMTMDQFVDFSILLGCDYCPTIKGIGAKKAISMIKQHHTIERVLEHLDRSKYHVPANFCVEKTRAMFKTPKVEASNKFQLEWKPPNVKELIHFLVDENGFSKERVTSGINSLASALSPSSAPMVQHRLTSFFTSSRAQKQDHEKVNRSDDKASCVPEKKRKNAIKG